MNDTTESVETWVCNLVGGFQPGFSNGATGDVAAGDASTYGVGWAWNINSITLQLDTEQSQKLTFLMTKYQWYRFKGIRIIYKPFFHNELPPPAATPVGELALSGTCGRWVPWSYGAYPMGGTLTLNNNIRYFTMVRDENDILVRSNSDGALGEYLQTKVMKGAFSARSDEPWSFDIIPGAFAGVGESTATPPLTGMDVDLARSIEAPWIATKAVSTGTLNNMPIHVGMKLYCHDPYLASLTWPTGGTTQFYPYLGQIEVQFMLQFKLRDPRAIIGPGMELRGVARTPRGGEDVLSDKGKLFRLLKANQVLNAPHVWGGSLFKRIREEDKQEAGAGSSKA